jgi:hypothetical protein
MTPMYIAPLFDYNVWASYIINFVTIEPSSKKEMKYLRRIVIKYETILGSQSSQIYISSVKTVPIRHISIFYQNICPYAHG